MWLKAEDGRAYNLNAADFVEVVQAGALMVMNTPIDGETSIRRNRATKPIFKVLAHFGEETLVLAERDTQEEAQQALDKIISENGGSIKVPIPLIESAQSD